MKRVSNPPQRYSAQELEWLDEAPEAALEVYEEEAKSVLTSNDSPDVGFEYSVNPYRGCFHACAYCYARPSHQYIDFGAGTDFERKIVVKKNAPEKLREAFMKRTWQGDEVVFSGITDCYQPLELKYELTKRCLEVCLEFRNPVAIITKSCIVRRDIPILKRLTEVAGAKVYCSIAFADDEMSKKIEPGAPRPSARFRAMRELTDAGVTVGVGIAPVIPGLNDSQIPEILIKANENGATSSFMSLLRLSAEVKDVFLSRLDAEYPARFGKVVSQIKQHRGGHLNNSAFGERMSGSGPEWEATKFLYRKTVEELGLNQRGGRANRTTATFRRPTNQLPLPGFDG